MYQGSHKHDEYQEALICDGHPTQRICRKLFYLFNERWCECIKQLRILGNKIVALESQIDTISAPPSLLVFERMAPGELSPVPVGSGGGGSIENRTVTRILNTEEFNSVVGASLTDDGGVYLPAGKYEVQGKGAALGTMQGRMYITVTSGTTTHIVLFGESSYAVNSLSYHEVVGQFVLDSAAKIHLQQFANRSDHPNSFGVPTDDTAPETYASLYIKKIS